MVITRNALRERIRRKEFYIVIAIGLLILVLLGGEKATMSIDGVELIDFHNVFGIIHLVVNAVACILAMIMSINTIPNEYRRKTSHLIWVREVSQTRYHGELALANFLNLVIALLILYGALAVYVIVNGEINMLPRFIPAFLILCINLAFISIFTSVLSIKLNAALVGLIMTIVIFTGVFHSMLETYTNILGGASKKLINALLAVIPSLHSVQQQAFNMISNNTLEIDGILKMLLATSILSFCFLVFRKKEA